MLKYGAIRLDLETGGVWGDSQHCPVEDLLESARFLRDLATTVQHRGLWGMGKAYDDDCYVLTTNKSFKVTTPHPGQFPNTGRTPRWIALHGSRHDDKDNYLTWLGYLEAA